MKIVKVLDIAPVKEYTVTLLPSEAQFIWEFLTSNGTGSSANTSAFRDALKEALGHNK